MSKLPVLILGASSEIGLAIAHRFAKEGCPIQLASRRPDELERTRSDLALRYNVKADVHQFDALDIESHESFVAHLPTLPEIAICTVGLLGNQRESEVSPVAAIEVMRSNFEGPANILGVLANHFERRGFGTLVGISSVAGDRGRASNYVYGSAKAGFSAYLSGLRHRLANKNIHILTVKLGFVQTRMIEGMSTPRILTVKPERVANAVFRSVSNGRPDVIYVHWLWRVIMWMIRAVPERIYKNLNI